MVDNKQSKASYYTNGSGHQSLMNDNQPTSIVTILSDMPISFDEIPFLRGAIIDKVRASNVLFHDHIDNGFRYSYPLIQYKAINGNAAVVAIAEGTNAIKGILPHMNSEVRIGNRRCNLSLNDVVTDVANVCITEEEHSYFVHRWLPFNQNNYAEYKRLDSLSQKVEMLQRLMIGNILSFAKGIGIYLNSKVEVSIIDINSVRQYRFKDVQMQGFDIKINTNVTLPTNIGLGKGVSIGFGIINEI